MRAVRVAVGLAFAFLSATVALAGPSFDNPKALLEHAYAPYIAGGMPDDQSEMFSSNLLALYEADAERAPEGEMGALEFDPFVNGQDYDGVQVEVLDPDVDQDQALAAVMVTNFGEENQMLFSLVREGGGWKIADIESTTQGNEWRLSDILAAPAR